MPLSPAENLIYTLIDLLKGAIPASILVFFLVFIGRKLIKKVEEITKRSWLVNALFTTFIILWFLIMLAYFFPVLTAFNSSAVGEIPSAFAPSLASILGAYALGIARVTISAAVVSILLLPLEFIGLYLFEELSKKFKKYPDYAVLALTVYLVVVVSSAIIIFLIPESITGLLFFIYFG